MIITQINENNSLRVLYLVSKKTVKESLVEVLGKWRVLHRVLLRKEVAVIWYVLAVSLTVLPCRCLRDGKCYSVL